MSGLSAAGDFILRRRIRHVTKVENTPLELSDETECSITHTALRMNDASSEQTQPKLTIEFVPKTCWFSNVRDHVPSIVWKQISAAVADKAGWRCEICGGQGHRHPVECHEVWHYDDKTQTQKLVRLSALCPSCHSVKHIGLAWKQGREKEALEHLAKVNQWHITRAEMYRRNMFDLWKRRSFFQWKLDLSYLDETFGIKIEEKR